MSFTKSAIWVSGTKIAVYQISQKTFISNSTLVKDFLDAVYMIGNYKIPPTTPTSRTSMYFPIEIILQPC